MARRVTIKRGDTLAIDFVCADEAGIGQDLTGYAVRSHLVFGADDPIVLTVAIDPDQTTNPGSVLVSYDGSTAAWPVAVGRFDLEFTDPDGRIESSETIDLCVVEDVTR